MFVFVPLVCLFVLVCLFCEWLCMRWPLYVARLRLRCHTCVDCMCDLLSCFLFVVVRLFCFMLSGFQCSWLCLFQGCVSYDTCVKSECVF